MVSGQHLIDLQRLQEGAFLQDEEHLEQLWDLTSIWLCAQHWNHSSDPSSEHVLSCQKVLHLAHAMSPPQPWIPKAALEKGCGVPVALENPRRKGGVLQWGINSNEIFLMRACVVVSHLWYNLMQEKRENSTSLIEHLLSSWLSLHNFHGSFVPSNSFLLPAPEQFTLLTHPHFSCLSAGFSRCFVVFFLSLLFCGCFVIPSFLLLASSHANPVKKLVVSCLLPHRRSEAQIRKVKSSAYWDVWELSFWNTP